LGGTIHAISVCLTTKSKKEKEPLEMLKSVRGVYRNGRVELLETPEDIGEAEVIVTFLPGPVVPAEKIIREKREAILRLAAQYGARNARFVPSLRVGGGKPETEVDFLVDLEQGRDAFDVAGLMADLSDLLDREVYVVTENGLHERIRGQALEEAVSV